MIGRIVGSIVITGLVALASDARAELDCKQIVTMSHFFAGKVSAEEMAKRLNTDVEMVRNCLDKKPQDTKSNQAAPPATK